MCALALLMLPGCTGRTTIEEERVLQAVRGDGEIGYYRLTITASAKLAKTDYKAGLYDAEALDALQSGALKDNTISVERTLERLRSEAVADIGADYYQALRSNPDLHAVQEIRARLAAALLSPWILASDAATGQSAAPRRKYAVIFSSLASVVEEAIASFASDVETSDTVLATIAGIHRERWVEAKARTDSLDASASILAKVHRDALAFDDAASAEELAESVRRWLEDVAAVRAP